jgi:hypothetical protein
MAHSQMEEHIIIKWLSLKSTIEYIGEWEILFTPDFNYTEIKEKTIDRFVTEYDHVKEVE